MVDVGKPEERMEEEDILGGVRWLRDGGSKDQALKKEVSEEVRRGQNRYPGLRCGSIGKV